MAINLYSCDHADEEEDYIDMEVSSHANLFCHSMNSPPHHREFEFQMSSGSLEREPSTSPADELFYKGKLLPLHLPPRLQMVEKLLQNSNSAFDTKKADNFFNNKAERAFEDFYSTPLATAAAALTTTSTPFESCNISPAESCQVSTELNPEEYFFEYSAEVSSFNGDNPKKSWTRKLKLIKQSSIGSKLKASRAYLKSLFSKSGCSHESCTTAAGKAEEASGSKAKECVNKYKKMAKKNPFGQIQDRWQRTSNIMSYDKEKNTEDNGGHPRRSFSLKRHSTANSSSSSSSSASSLSSCSGNSNGFYELQLLKRSSSANSDIESSIQGAIAHCKQSLSQQLLHSRKTASEVGFCSFSGSRIAVCEESEIPGLCRG